MTDRQPENYETAYGELKQIIDRLESPQTKVDEIEVLIQRSETLIAYCQSQLSKIESTTNEILSRLQSEEETQ